MPALSCREGRFSFFCWHWRSGRGDGGMPNFTVVFIRCGFGSALLGFVDFFPLSSKHSADGRSVSLLECVTVEKKHLSSLYRPPHVHIFIWKVMLRIHEHGNLSVLGISIWLSGHSYTVFVPENQLHVLWGKFEHPESLWKSEFSRPFFCAVVEQKREEIKPELNQAKLLLNKCISCTPAVRKQRLFLSSWHGADWFLQPGLFRFAPTVFCPKSVF